MRRPTIARCLAVSQAPLTQGRCEKPQVTTMIMDPARSNQVARMTAYRANIPTGRWRRVSRPHGRRGRRFHERKLLPLQRPRLPIRALGRFCAEPFRRRARGDAVLPAFRSPRSDAVTIRDYSSRSPSIEVVNARSSQIHKLHHYPALSMAFGVIRAIFSAIRGQHGA